MNKLLLVIFFLTTTAVALEKEPEVIHINKLEILVFGSNKVQVLKEGKTLLNYDCIQNGCVISVGNSSSGKELSVENETTRMKINCKVSIS